MVIKDLEYLLDPESWPEFMRSALLPAQSRRVWTDADWAANEARINMLNAGISGGLRGNLLPKMPWPPRPTQQAPDADRAAPLFMRSASMPAPPSRWPDNEWAGRRAWRHDTAGTQA